MLYVKSISSESDVDEKGPYTKLDKLRGGQHGGPTNSNTKINHIGCSDVKYS